MREVQVGEEKVAVVLALLHEVLSAFQRIKRNVGRLALRTCWSSGISNTSALWRCKSALHRTRDTVARGHVKTYDAYHGGAGERGDSCYEGFGRYVPNGLQGNIASKNA